MLTNEELNAINRNLESHLGLFSDAEMDRDQKTYCTFRPHELHSMKEAIDELLALRSLRDAGDDEVEELYSNAVRIALFSTNANDRKISVTNIAELRAIARGQQLREAREEIERLKNIYELAMRERDTVTGELVALQNQLVIDDGQFIGEDNSDPPQVWVWDGAISEFESSVPSRRLPFTRRQKPKEVCDE